jgi:hypothetical protein
MRRWNVRPIGRYTWRFRRALKKTKPIRWFRAKLSGGSFAGDNIDAIADATNRALDDDKFVRPHDTSWTMEGSYEYDLTRFTSWLGKVQDYIQDDGFTFNPKPDIGGFASDNLDKSLADVRYAISLNP